MCIRNIDILFAVHLTDRNVHIQIIQLGKINYEYILKDSLFVLYCALLILCEYMSKIVSVENVMCILADKYANHTLEFL